MLTFDQAREVFTRTTGYATEPHGIEGPDRYIVVPVIPPWPMTYNDSVQIVTKSGHVEQEHYDREVMGAWPAVIAGAVVAAAAPSQARAPKGTPIGGEWIETPKGLIQGIGVRENLVRGFADPKALANARSVAKRKEAALPEPTDADRKIAHERHAKSKRQGGDDRPGSVRRKKLRQDLLTEFGDGETCPCLNCGRVLDITTVSMDRIIPGADNGRYVPKNLIPMDYDCNRARSDTDFEEMAATWAALPLGDEPAVTPGTQVRGRPSGWDANPDSDEFDEAAFNGTGPDDAPSLEGVPEWIEGPLEVVPVDGYLKHIVGGYDVDPASIEET
jgi:hypothetical protein